MEPRAHQVLQLKLSYVTLTVGMIQSPNWQIGCPLDYLQNY